MPRPGDRLGRYHLEATLGVGGTGRVFRARDEQLGRLVAVKVITVSERDPSRRARWKWRLLREAQAAAALNHPSVVSVFDFGEVDDVSFIVMELVEGRSLRSFVGDARIRWERRLRYLTEAARALRAVHAAGLVHRDVKPDNILVRRDGAIKLVDLGFAEVLPGELDGSTPPLAQGTASAREAIVGTPLYMTPEQLRGEECDGRSDQYSWGITAYEVLSGRHPWPAIDIKEVLHSIAQGREIPPPLSSLPDVVNQAIGRSLRHHPDERWPNMNAIIELIGPFAERTASVTRRLSGKHAARLGTLGSGSNRPASAGESQAPQESTLDAAPQQEPAVGSLESQETEGRALHGTKPDLPGSEERAGESQTADDFYSEDVFFEEGIPESDSRGVAASGTTAPSNIGLDGSLEPLGDLLPPSDGSVEPPTGVSLLGWSLLVGALVLLVFVLAGRWLSQEESATSGAPLGPDAGIELPSTPGTGS